VPEHRTHTGEWRQYAQPALIAWAVYLFLTPFYVFASGLPQPGDLFVIVLVPIALRRWNGRLPVPALPAVRALCWFTLWVFVVDYVWTIALGNFSLFGPDSLVLYPLYYIYNTLLFLVGIVLFQRHGERFLRVTLFVTYLSVAMLVVASFFHQTGIRGSIFFNNPNQLGYYGLLAACLVVLLHWRLRLRLWTSGAIIACCGYLAALSASRSAIGGIAILLTLLVFSNPRIALGVAAAAILLLFAGGLIIDAINAAEDRVRNRRSNVGFFEERGYARIREHPEYLVFGAGEGGLSRFAENRRSQYEIHSSGGTVLFSYGLIGTLVFLAFLWYTVRGVRWRLSFVLIPPLFYGLAHQGLRFTTLWVLLALFVALKPEHAHVRSRSKPRATARNRSGDGYATAAYR